MCEYNILNCLNMFLQKHFSTGYIFASMSFFFIVLLNILAVQEQKYVKYFSKIKDFKNV